MFHEVKAQNSVLHCLDLCNSAIDITEIYKLELLFILRMKAFSQWLQCLPGRYLRSPPLREHLFHLVRAVVRVCHLDVIALGNARPN